MVVWVLWDGWPSSRSAGARGRRIHWVVNVILCGLLIAQAVQHPHMKGVLLVVLTTFLGLIGVVSAIIVALPIHGPNARADSPQA